MQKKFVFILQALFVFVAFPFAAQAADAIWTGSTSGAWNNNANWGGTPFPNSGDTATFDSAGNANTTITLGQDITLGGLIFDSSSCAAYTFNAGNNLNLASGASVSISSTVANSQVINSAVVIQGPVSISNASASAEITLAGNITSSGSPSLTKDGSGGLVLSGANTYSGATTINGGTLQLGSGSALPSATTLGMSGTGVLDLNGNDATITSFDSTTTGNLITNTAGGAGVDTLTVSASTTTLSADVDDDGVRKIALILIGGNGGAYDPVDTSVTRTFSGGITLRGTDTAGGRLTFGPASNSPETGGPLGRGTITIDRYTQLGGSGWTIGNDVIVNEGSTAIASRNGTVRSGACAFSGTVTVSNDHMVVRGGPATFTGKVTGPKGMKTAGSDNSVIILDNAAEDNDYADNTSVGANEKITLARVNQIPNGAGKGNVSIASGGTLNLAGYEETINGLSGAGTIDNLTSTNAINTLTFGDGDADGLDFSGTTTNTAGILHLVKIGSGTNTISGTLSHSGETTINGGALRLTSTNTFNETSVISIASGAKMNLDFSGENLISILYLDGSPRNIGSYNATTAPTYFTGIGTLRVQTAIPTIIMIR